MFKLENLEQELYKSMEKTLIANQVENTHGFNKLAKAADYLHNAAKIFEQAGMISEANEVLYVLQNLTK
jgi:hypothetical protein